MRATTLLLIALLPMSFITNVTTDMGSSPITVNLKAQADCYVSENNPDSAYGREVVLNVRSYFDGEGHYNHRTYIQFDLTTIPRDVTILSALLWLYKNPEGANPGIRNVQAFKVMGAWNEYTLDWNNQPSVSPKPAACTEVASPMKWYTWNLTQDVKAWHDQSAPNYGMMLKDEVEDSRTDYASVFLSREASHPENPFLEIRYIKSGGQTTSEITSVGSQVPSFIWVGLLLSAGVIILAGIGWRAMKRKLSS
jgi:hypothetical protein